MDDMTSQLPDAHAVAAARFREESEAIEQWLTANLTEEERSILLSHGELSMSVERMHEVQRGVEALKKQMRSAYDFDIRAQ